MRSSLTLIAALAILLASCARIPTPQDANDAVFMLREYDSWAWALGIALIWADLVLPVPQTAVIAALGIIYGTLLGGLLGSIGLISGGVLGYALMRTSARRFVDRLVGRQSLHKMESLFDQAGAWAIVLTRSLPYSVPEAIVFLAGLAGMPMGKFTLALTVGSVPTAFAFAAIGAGWADQPILVLTVSYVLPILLLPIALYVMRLRASLGDVDPRHSTSRGLAARLRRARALIVGGRATANAAGRCPSRRSNPGRRKLRGLRAVFPSSWYLSGNAEGPAALVLALCGCLLALAGAALVLWSRVELGSAWSLVPTADQGKGPVTTGPYRFVRHPIYLGLSLLAMGEALAFSSWPAAAVVFSAIVPTFVWRASTEEKLLTDMFGEQYAHYRKQTRMMIPYLL